MKMGFWITCLLAHAIYLCSVLASYPLVSVLVLGLALFFCFRELEEGIGLDLSPITLSLLGLGLSVSLAAGLLGLPWLATFGFLSTVFAFFSCQRDSQQHSLTRIGLVAIPLLTLSQSQSEVLFEFLRDAKVAAAHMILRSCSVPHFIDDNTFRFVQSDIAVDYCSWAGLRIFVLLAGAWSVVRSRPLIVGLANTLLASLCWFTFQSLALVLPGLASGMSLTGMLVANGIVTTTLFLSSERGIRGMLEPISDDQADSRNTNPLVTFWNWFGVGRSIRNPTAPRYLIAVFFGISILTFAVQAAGLI